MRHAALSDMVKGWFIGDFEPSVLRNRDCEVAVKTYNAGDCEALHHHRIATEVTVVVSGTVEMLGRRWEAGDIIVLEPGEATGFRACTPAVCVVVKTPSVAGDKFTGAIEELRRRKAAAAGSAVGPTEHQGRASLNGGHGGT
jgi:hypothetical protein